MGIVGAASPVRNSKRVDRGVAGASSGSRCTSSNGIVCKHVDPKALARELGVVKDYEQIIDED